MFSKHKILLSLLLFFFLNASWALEKITLWPTVLFIKAQDLCQYQDAYGQSRNESMLKASQQISQLISSGVDSQSAASILVAMDELVDKNRELATAG